MAAGGQTITTDSVLGAFDATGTYLGDILVVPSNVGNSGAGTPWLMATAEFTALTASDALRDVLGDPPNPALKSDADLSRCQAEVTRNLGRFAGALAKSLNRTKKTALLGKKVPQVLGSRELAAALEPLFGDPKIAKVTAKAAAKIAKRCPAGDLSAAFPGVCDATSAAALADCTAARARCRVCLAFETADALDLDCDAASGVACPAP
ncbi:MAG: hypothetical protein OEP95_12050 [Myxococcales bacterium]|nr:hypothetical protein [Myxococcales bacterium]